MRTLGSYRSLQGDMQFRVWAPKVEFLFLKIRGQQFPMNKEAEGYFFLSLPWAQEGDLYTYVLPDGKEYPDPVSSFLPQ